MAHLDGEDGVLRSEMDSDYAGEKKCTDEVRSHLS